MAHGVAMRMGLRMRGNVLYFEETPVVDLAYTKLTPTDRGRLAALVDGIEGRADPERSLRREGFDAGFAYHEGLGDDVIPE